MAVMLAAQAIRLGEADVVAAGGMGACRAPRISFPASAAASASGPAPWSTP
jgi:acetyl-CoA acetyltransferase